MPLAGSTAHSPAEAFSQADPVIAPDCGRLGCSRFVARMEQQGGGEVADSNSAVESGLMS
jgi:hypothetical protein